MWKLGYFCRKNCNTQKFRLILPCRLHLRSPVRDYAGGIADIFWKRLSALILDNLKFSQNFTSIVKDLATVDARGCVIHTVCRAVPRERYGCGYYIYYIYERGLLRCRPTIDGQCEKPQVVGRQQVMNPRFFRICTFPYAMDSAYGF